jgi:ribosome maturation factor RimP
MDLAQAAREVLAPLGYEVLETKVSTSGRVPRVIVRIDRLDEGVVSVEDVQGASEAFGLELDRLDPFEGAYHLEVESPGAKRPLIRARHFERFHDLRAKVRTRERAFTGVVREVEGDAVAFEVDGERLTVALDDIETARLAEWPDEPR